MSQKLGLFASKEKGEYLLVLKELIEAGKVTPVIDKTYPLGEVPMRSASWKRGMPEGSSSSPSEAGSPD